MPEPICGPCGVDGKTDPELFTDLCTAHGNGLLGLGDLWMDVTW